MRFNKLSWQSLILQIHVISKIKKHASNAQIVVFEIQLYHCLPISKTA